MPNTFMNSAEIAVMALLQKKGLDIRLYHVEDKSTVTDYYLNVTARSGLQVMALSDAVIDELKKTGLSPLHTEGKSGKNWILIDYGFLVINIFDKPTREFYDFDRLLPENSLVNIDHCVSIIDEKFDINRKE